MVRLFSWIIHEPEDVILSEAPAKTFRPAAFRGPQRAPHRGGLVGVTVRVGRARSRRICGYSRRQYRRVRTVPSLKGLVNFPYFTQGLTTPTRATTARVGNPGTPWARTNSAPMGLDFAQSFHRANPKRFLTPWAVLTPISGRSLSTPGVAGAGEDICSHRRKPWRG
jgi:hypothetical protein